ncbi:MAG: hypothetical protein R3F65_14720 [bacterium]
MDLDAFATYWFGRFPDLSLWFYEGDHYDHEVERFRPLFDAVADGRLGPSTRTEALLTLVVLDQLPRDLPPRLPARLCGSTAAPWRLPGRSYLAGITRCAPGTSSSVVASEHSDLDLHALASPLPRRADHPHHRSDRIGRTSTTR